MVEREPKHRNLDEWGYGSLILGLMLLGIGGLTANEARIENIDLVLKAGIVLTLTGAASLWIANRK